MMITMLNFIALSGAPAARAQLLVEVALKGALILFAAGILSLLLRRAAAATRHLVWTAALGSVLALPLLSLLLPGWQAPLLPALMTEQRGLPAEALPAATALTAEIIAPEVEDTRLAYPPLTESISRQSLKPDLLPSSESSVRAPASVNWPQLMLLIWLTGMFIVLTRLLISLIRVWAIAREAQIVTDYAWTTLTRRLVWQLQLDKHIPLLKSDQITMPMTWGVWRPVALLPEDADEWSAEWREIVLLHELAHIKRRDCLTQLLAQMACALYWFNPLVWIGARRLRVERELACDDYVLASGARASDYAGYLVDIARTMSNVGNHSSVAVGMACSQLESRVRAILDPAIRRRGLTRRLSVVSAIIVAALIIPLAALQPWANAEAQEKKKSGKSAAPLDTPQPKDKARERSEEILPEENEREALAAALAEDKVEAADGQDRAAEIRAELREQEQELKDRLKELIELQVKNATDSKQIRARVADHLAKLQAEIAAIPLELVADAISRADLEASLKEKLKEKLKQKDKRKKVEEALADQEKAVAELRARAQSAGQSQGRAEGLTAESLIQLKMQGVTPEYIEALRRLGYEDLSIRDITQLKTHGVSEEFIKEARSLSGEKLTVRELLDLRISGVTAEYAREMKKAGYDLPLKSLARMRMFGVTPEYIETLRKNGYSNLSADQITKLRMHGVSESYIKDMRGAGFANLSAEELTRLRMHGVTPEYVEALRKNGYGNLTAEQITRLRMHGVSENYIKEMRDAGFDKLTVEELTRMRRHGVTGEYVKRMRAAGLKNISADQLLQMKMRGIDEILLKK
jgi:beta-lactamase regulating signal transducer with metallopeptidase domain